MRIQLPVKMPWGRRGALGMERQRGGVRGIGMGQEERVGGERKEMEGFHIHFLGWQRCFLVVKMVP